MVGLFKRFGVRVSVDEAFKALAYANEEYKKFEETELGIDDKFYARAYRLHMLGFHEGALDPVDIEEELKKAEEYLKTIENLVK